MGIDVGDHVSKSGERFEKSAHASKERPLRACLTLGCQATQGLLRFRQSREQGGAKFQREVRSRTGERHGDHTRGELRAWQLVLEEAPQRAAGSEATLVAGEAGEGGRELRAEQTPRVGQIRTRVRYGFAQRGREIVHERP